MIIPLFKLKITKMNNKVEIMSTSFNIVKGTDLLSIQTGTIVRVFNAELESVIGDFLLKTDSPIYPLISLKDGVLWGSNLGQYVFQIIKDATLKLIV